MLVHTNDKKNCPSKVARCFECKLAFQEFDAVVIKTEGVREWYDKKSGVCRKSSGNVYIHSLSGRLSSKVGFNIQVQQHYCIERNT